MNMSKYLTNPMGKGASVLSFAPIRNELDKQYNILQHAITVAWYSMGDFLVAHVKVPSHSIENLFYDVLIEIDTESIPDNITVINNANVRVFSNCPSFVFTFANIFQKNGDFIDWAGGKYPKEIMKKDPETRNPAGIVSYERSLYLAFKYILSNGRNYKNRVKLNLVSAKAKQILKDVKSSEEILKEYQKGKDKQKERDAELKKKNLKETKPAPSTKLPPKKAPSGVKTTKKTKKSRSTAKTKTVKKI